MYYLIRKFFTSFLSLFLIFTLTFIIMKNIPGDPFTQEKALPKEVMEALYTHYHLDEPLIKQYVHYLECAFKADFGPSLVYQARDVNQMVKQGFKISFQLGLQAFIIALFLGILFGTSKCFFEKRWQSLVCSFLGIFFLTIPPFILATFLQEIFAVRLNLLPIAKWGNFSHTLLPSLSLALFPAASIGRLLSVQMKEVLQTDYIKLAKLKGLSTFRIFMKHALKNSFLPILGYLGPLLTTIMTGTFLIEKIYGIGGLGNWFVTSVLNRDYPLIMGITCLYGFFLLGTIFIMDVIAMLLNPKLRKEMVYVS